VGQLDRPPQNAGRHTTVADVVVRELVSAGVTHVFGVGGTHTLQFLRELERAPGIRYVTARTELGAAYMAVGFARASRNAAVLLTSTGPGALNVAAALQDASWSSTPVLHLTTRIGGPTFSGDVHETPGQHEILATPASATSASARSICDPAPLVARRWSAARTAVAAYMPVSRSHAGTTWLTGEADSNAARSDPRRETETRPTTSGLAGSDLAPALSVTGGASAQDRTAARTLGCQWSERRRALRDRERPRPAAPR
jgi:Thiamine pyrophosphate enzyme, N-terminal TPP binding domain